MNDFRIRRNDAGVITLEFSVGGATLSIRVGDREKCRALGRTLVAHGANWLGPITLDTTGGGSVTLHTAKDATTVGDSLIAAAR